MVLDVEAKNDEVSTETSFSGIMSLSLSKSISIPISISIGSGVLDLDVGGDRAELLDGRVKVSDDPADEDTGFDLGADAEEVDGVGRGTL